MDALFRLNQDVDGFSSIDETKYFFRETLPKRDGNYFFHTKKMRGIETNDKIYFSYNGYIVAKAYFDGEIKTDKERDEDFVQGHKVKNIEIVDSNLQINSQIVKGRGIKYIDSDEVREEIQRVLGLSKTIYPDEVENDSTLIEGAKRQVTVNAYERNSKARQECINKYGYDCFVCGFNFVNAYGALGDKFIHVHHIKPLSEINQEYEINPIEDLRPVCPNCHAMLHRRTPAYSIEEIKNAMGKKGL